MAVPPEFKITDVPPDLRGVLHEDVPGGRIGGEAPEQIEKIRHGNPIVGGGDDGDFMRSDARWNWYFSRNSSDLRNGDITNHPLGNPPNYTPTSFGDSHKNPTEPVANISDRGRHSFDKGAMTDAHARVTALTNDERVKMKNISDDVNAGRADAAEVKRCQTILGEHGYKIGTKKTPTGVDGVAGIKTKGAIQQALS